MSDTKAFLGQTAATASFAFAAYFRPLVVAVRFFVSKLPSAKSLPKNRTNPEEAKAILRERLADDRHQKRSS